MALNSVDDALNRKNTARANNIKGRILFEENNNLESLSYHKAACQMDPANTKYLVDRANVQFSLRLLDESLSSVEEALRIDPYCAAALSLKSKILSFLNPNGDGSIPDELTNKILGVSVLEASSQIVEKFPFNPSALILKGHAMLKLGDLKAADELFKKAYDLLLIEALSYFNSGDFDNALRCVESLLSLEGGM